MKARYAGRIEPDITRQRPISRMEVSASGSMAMDWNWYLFRLDGRINRAKMWLGMLVIVCGLMLVSGLMAGVFALLGGTRPFEFGLSLGDFFTIFDPASYRSLSPAHLAIFLCKAGSSAVLLWIGFAIAVKRLHDRDKSGWWMVPFFVIPTLYNTFGDGSPTSTSSTRCSQQPSSCFTCGASSNCIASRVRGKPTGSAPTRWHRRRRAIGVRAGISKARSKWCRRLVRRRFGVLSRWHE
jgi:uncharacterized membrane protein YhaH (DUF805 family)